MYTRHGAWEWNLERWLFRISERCLGSDSFLKTSPAISRRHHGPFLCSFLYLLVTAEKKAMLQSHQSPDLLQSSASWAVHRGMPLMAVVKATYTRSKANAQSNIWTMLSMGRFSYKSMKLFVLNKSRIQFLFSKHSKVQMYFACHFSRWHSTHTLGETIYPKDTVGSIVLICMRTFYDICTIT